ncbi:hypothetical protein QJQ45_021926 [Haematococcus lacustris]|nr:hypothetical protein QJQ45_021926 [Haematococcus lacustris]
MAKKKRKGSDKKHKGLCPQPTVGYPTPAQPASMVRDSDSDSESDCDSERESQFDSEPEPKPEPVTQPPPRRCSARLAALAPAAPIGPPLPPDSEDPVMLRQLKEFCEFFANLNFKIVYNQLQRRLVSAGQYRHPMLMPVFEDPSNQALLAKLQELGNINLRGDANTIGAHAAGGQHAAALCQPRQVMVLYLTCTRPDPTKAAGHSAGTFLEADLKHITVTRATWDAVWEVYLDPKWARQRLRLYGAQDRAQEQFFNKLEEDMAEVSMKRHGRAKQLGVFYGAAGICTGGGWGADAVQQQQQQQHVSFRPRQATTGSSGWLDHASTSGDGPALCVPALFVLTPPCVLACQYGNLAWLQVIKVPEGAVLRGCKKTRRKLREHLRLRAEIHSQLRVIASLLVLKIFLTCLVGYPTPGFPSAPQPPAVQPPQPPDAPPLPPHPHGPLPSQHLPSLPAWSLTLTLTPSQTVAQSQSQRVLTRPRGPDQLRGRVVVVDEHRTSQVSSAVNGQQPCEVELDKLSATRPADWKPPAGQVEPRLLRPAWSQERGQPVRGMMCSQAATPAAASEPGPSTPLPAKRCKRTKAEPAAEPTKGKGKGKAAKAKLSIPACMA